MRTIEMHQPEEAINMYVCSKKDIHLHNHNFLELAYVAGGNATHILNGKKTVIKKGDYLFMDYNAKHAYKQLGTEPLEIINCLFEPGLIDKTLKHCRNFYEIVNHYTLKFNPTAMNPNPANYIFYDESGTVYETLQKMITEYNQKKSGYLELLRCHLIELIVITMRQSTPPNNIISDSVCDYIIQYTADNYVEKNILSNISKKLNFSTAYVSQKFKNVMQISFTEYLQTIRLSESCRLLVNTNKKIFDIAQCVGYSDMKFFNLIFKKY
ncbi:MAG: helix-turn-helix domain-containing protein, partial [Ruminococcaceae bacterium]|nr:helix-turn-helix domain-containing protein [Oscillospiraceae bacterium]